jgi:hypothetical protein
MADNILHGLLSRVRKLIPQGDECLSCHCVDKKRVSSSSKLFSLELKINKTQHMRFELIFFTDPRIKYAYIYLCTYVSIYIY